MSFRKILCALDFSETSTEALRVAVRLAIEDGSELVIAHAWYLDPTAFAGEYFYPAALIDELTADAKRALAETTKQAESWGATKVSSVLLDGPPWQQIVGLAERTPAIDLIVAGTRGRTGLARMFLGSVCEMILRHAPCSVLAIPQGASAAPFGRVLCPIDFSESSRHALELGATLAKSSEPSVTLLHVIEPPRISAHEVPVVEATTKQVVAAHAELERWAATLTAKQPIPTTCLVRVGRSTLEIQNLLEQVPVFDLLAMGSHGRTGLRRLVLGSVAEKTVRHAHRAVLVARDPRS